MIFLLAIILFVNFIYCLYSFASYLNPGSMFGAGFLLASLMCIWYYSEWNINNLHSETFFIIATGVPIFTLVCKLVDKPKVYIEETSVKYNFSNKFLWLCIIYQVIVSFLTIRTLMQVTGSTDLTLALTLFREQKTDESDTYKLPLLVRNLAFLAQALGYYFSYVSARMLVEKKTYKQTSLAFIIFALGTIISLRGGSRGDFVLNIIGFVIFLHIFKIKLVHKKIKLKFRKLIKYGVLGVILLYSFVMSITFLGNKDSDSIDPIYGFAVYCGAEIKNLDYFVCETYDISPIFAKYTLGRNLSYQDDINFYKFRWVNSYNLGNVYTCFQNYYKDFGLFGTFIVIILIAFITQKLYLHALRSRNVYKKIFDWRIFIFVFVIQRLAFSFFSEKFFLLIQWNYLKIILFVYFVNWYVKRYGLIINTGKK